MTNPANIPVQEFQILRRTVVAAIFAAESDAGCVAAAWMLQEGSREDPLAARRDQLIGRNVHRGGDNRLNAIHEHFLRARRAIVVVDRNGGFAGHVRDRPGLRSRHASRGSPCR